MQTIRHRRLAMEGQGDLGTLFLLLNALKLCKYSTADHSPWTIVIDPEYRNCGLEETTLRWAFARLGTRRKGAWTAETKPENIKLLLSPGWGYQEHIGLYLRTSRQSLVSLARLLKHPWNWSIERLEVLPVLLIYGDQDRNFQASLFAIDALPGIQLCTCLKAQNQNSLLLW